MSLTIDCMLATGLEVLPATSVAVAVSVTLPSFMAVASAEKRRGFALRAPFAVTGVPPPELDIATAIVSLAVFRGPTVQPTQKPSAALLAPLM